jgi:serine phosphatase RsbU (regulator of sigma subunit)
MFDWQCEVKEAALQPRDILAIGTYGVFLASDLEGNEFGEDGLLRALRVGRDRNAQDLLESVVERVKQFAPGEQADDLTLLIAKARS